MYDISLFSENMFKKIKQNRMFEKISDQVLEAILRGDLKPGDKLPSENEFGEIFGVSRVTVREALRSLEQFGVVEVRQGSQGGAYIKEVNLDSVASQVGSALKMIHITFPHLAQARAALEKTALEELMPPEIPEKDLKDLEENIRAAGSFYEHHENGKRLRANFEFHTLIAGLTGNPIIILMHKLIVDLSVRFFESVEPSPRMIEKTLEEHSQILEFLKQGRFQEAGWCCSRHIREVSRRIIEKSKNQSLLNEHSPPEPGTGVRARGGISSRRKPHPAGS